MIAKFVSRPVDHSCANPATCKPYGESSGMVVSALTAFGGRCAAKLSAPNNQGTIEQSPVFQVGEQSSNRPVGFSTMKVVIFLQIVMCIPRLRPFIAPAVKLNKTDTALNEPPGEKTIPTKVMGSFVIEPIEILIPYRFLSQIDRFRCVRLHTESQLVRGDASGEGRFCRIGRSMAFVPLFKQIETGALATPSHPGRWRKIGNRFAIGSKWNPLICCGHKTIRPVHGAVDRGSLVIKHHDKTRQVFAFGAKPVG